MWVPSSCSIRADADRLASVRRVRLEVARTNLRTKVRTRVGSETGCSCGCVVSAVGAMA